MKSNDSPAAEELSALWARHNARWRDPAQIASHMWDGAAGVDPELLRYEVSGAWWEALAATGATLLVTREYEHLAMAMCVDDGAPVLSYMSLPHPSGLAVDAARGIVHIASTRNPNQVFDLAPAKGRLARLDVDGRLPKHPSFERPLVPVRSRFFPGCFYIHDLALVGGALHANSVGQNAVVRLYDDGSSERVWWPRCIEVDGEPVFGQNHIQLNSIAAGGDVASSYYSASTDRVSARRPGHKNFPVDARGVVFSGATREPVVRGLTRPHSARLHKGRIWVDNSGYGEVVIVDGGGFTPVVRLPGWTRGLCFHADVAFVGTSRVIPRFRQYAPGLDVDHSVCGIHAVDTGSGRVLGSLVWPYGNQLFAIDTISSRLTRGFPFPVGAKRALEGEKKLFYAFKV
ncbi:MAG: TIGR03032 family protein [Bacteroidetes bacterium]|nr:TIGR03032 family protein [Bacteroidota bacterium]MCL5026738.1 TIGR03032 family protein [Chloroflexota bacterium]